MGKRTKFVFKVQQSEFKRSLAKIWLNLQGLTTAFQSMDLSKVQAYSTALSEKLLSEMYKGKESLNGAEIVNFSALEALNLMVVKALFGRWQEEMSKLKSPYFDYDHEDVQIALKQFMNKLSKHMQVRKEFMRPLLIKGIQDTLTWTLAPELHLKAEYYELSAVSATFLKERKKYYKVHAALFDAQIAVADKLGKEVTGAALEAATAKVDLKALKDPVAEEAVIAQFSDWLSVKILDFEAAEEEQVQVKSKPNDSKINVSSKPEALPLSQTKSINQDKSTDSLTLNQRFSDQETKTLNDSMKGRQQGSLGEKLSKRKIEDLKSSIPLNLKFLFINVLFEGKSSEYNEALNLIEGCQDFNTAKTLLDSKYGERHAWAKHEQAAGEFWQLIQRKFY